MIVHLFEQGTEEWNQVRIGKMTGSDAGVFLVNGKSETEWGAAVQSYIYKKVAERITGEIEYFKPNFAMERGTMLEPVAIAEYEKVSWNQVERVGFVEMNDFVGCSPDGLIGNDGMIEVKCPLGTEFLRFADTLEIPPAHYAQMQFNLFVTRRIWCDYVVFHPQFDPKILIERIELNPDICARFAKAAEYFEAEARRLVKE